jgi:hypothetical protein
MDLQTSKLELVKLIVNIDNQHVIDRLINALKSEQDDFWFELTEQEKQEIELGIKQLDSGKRVSLEDFLKKVS